MAKKPFTFHIDPSMFEPAGPEEKKELNHTKEKPFFLAGCMEALKEKSDSNDWSGTDNNIASFCICRAI